MKIRLLMATATAASVLMGTAALANDNNSALFQDGADNTLSVVQDGRGNWAGRDAYNDQLTQKGNKNKIVLLQEGDYNRVGTYNTNSVWQAKDGNEVNIRQTGFNNAPDYSDLGNQIWTVIQTGTIGAAAGASNKVDITQEGDSARTSPDLRATHRVKSINQTHGGGAANTIKIVQQGENDRWHGGSIGNQIESATQNGSGNSLDVLQKGTGPLTGPYSKRTGPQNLLSTATQIGDGNFAKLTQDGYHNLTTLISQTTTAGGVGNKAELSFQGNENGRGAFTTGSLAADVTNATVTQIGGGNEIDYAAIGSYNEYGFYQNGTANKAVGIDILGSYNKLAVKQTGNRNVLELAAISGDANNIGLVQNGSDNLAKLDITVGGDRNGGAGAFTSPASTAGLPAGLLEQLGNWNSVDLKVTGDDNVFATKQDSGGYSGALVTNKIIGKVTGGFNQAAVKQIGTGNTTIFTQNGTSNNAYVSQ